MFFRKDKKHTIKKIDAIITGIVVGWVVASVYWIKKYDQSKNEKITKEEHIENKSENKKMSKSEIIKALIFGNKKEITQKPKFFTRIFRKILWKK